MATPTEQQKQPSEEKLKLLLSNGPEMIDLVQRQIDNFKLPYIIVKHPTEMKWELRPMFTRGEEKLNSFITVDAETVEMKEDAAKMSKHPHEVLIIGETGTGKEMIALSQIGDREGEIRVVNCAGLPRELIEGELFGYVAGSYTGAQKTTDGIIKSAEKGLVFFDEIGELPLDVQGKLLRVLQNKSVRKIGGKVEERIDCKFAFATNRDLAKMVKQGMFREDLYARISTLELFIKPLRERECDVVPILKSLPGGDKFLERYGDKLDLLDLSLNVRSLQQYVVRYAVLGRVKIER